MPIIDRNTPAVNRPRPAEAAATIDPTLADRLWLALNPGLPPALPGHTIVYYPSSGPLAWSPRRNEPTAYDASWEARHSAWRNGGPEVSRVMPAGVRYDEHETPSKIDRGFADADMMVVGAVG